MENPDFKFRDAVIPVVMVPIDSRLTYNSEDTLQELIKDWKKGNYGPGRLTSWRLAECIGYLLRQELSKDQERRSVKVHLVIPPELICTAKKILESENTPEAQIPIVNFVSQFVGGVWIDINIEGSHPPNWPWFVFSDVDLITKNRVNTENMCYRSGTAP